MHHQTPFRIRTVTRVALCGVVLALSACAIVKPVWYQTRPDDQQQTVSIRLVGSAFIEKLDGNRLAEPLETWNGGYAAVREIRILPGVHSVSGVVGYHNVNVPYDFRQDFRAGHYEISAYIEGYEVRAQLKRLEGQP